MPRDSQVRVVEKLASRGYNAEREAVTLIASAPDPDEVIERVVEKVAGDALVVRTEDVRPIIESDPVEDPIVSTGDDSTRSRGSGDKSPVETEGLPSGEANGSVEATGAAVESSRAGEDAVESSKAGEGAAESSRAGEGGGRAVGAEGFERSVDESLRSVEIAGDMTGDSTGTGDYEDFVAVFRDRYDRLGGKLRSRVNHRPAEALEALPGGSDAAMVGMVNDIRSTASGHWLVELEDTSGVFPGLVMKDRAIADQVDELLLDEVIAIEGTLSGDGGIVFVDAIHFPDIPRTYRPSTADREVSAALVSDIHVGSQEFLSDAWSRFADWLHTPEAERIEYLVIAGDMVEGVGVYPGQEEELDVIDIYDQYERFSERLKEVPGDMEVVMIPGNHDAVRLAEPQPAFDEELRETMCAHDATIVSNPSTITLEGVSILAYHGTSMDELIAELPSHLASYDEPHKAMFQQLKKRHLAPQYGGRIRIAPEERDHLVIEEIPDIFHAGHVHKLGVGAYHNVRVVNSGCWQAQTDFQRSVNLDPDVAVAPVVDLDTLDITVRKFA